MKLINIFKSSRKKKILRYKKKNRTNWKFENSKTNSQTKSFVPSRIKRRLHSMTRNEAGSRKARRKITWNVLATRHATQRWPRGLIRDSRGGIQAAMPHDNYSERKHRPRERERKRERKRAPERLQDVRRWEDSPETLSRRLIKINNLERAGSREDSWRRIRWKTGRHK